MKGLIDTHAHLFEPEFENDLPEVVERARNVGVSQILLPNIDSTTIDRMLDVCENYPDICFPMIGLHPTSVKENFRQELDVMEGWLKKCPGRFVAIGEVGLDLYWDQTFCREQEIAFRQQLEWASDYDLPVVIHARDAFDLLYKIMSDYKQKNLKGIFHSFTGTYEEAEKLLEFDGFKLGINGVLTFKKSTLPQVLQALPLEKLVLETDAPYLTPVPFRGKRNETSFLKYTLAKVAEIFQMEDSEVMKITSKNAIEVFKMKEKVSE